MPSKTLIGNGESLRNNYLIEYYSLDLMVTPRRKAALPINVSPPKARRSSIKTDNDETSSTNTENSSSSSKAKRRKIKPMKQLLETMQADYGADPIFQNFNCTHCFPIICRFEHDCAAQSHAKEKVLRHYWIACALHGSGYWTSIP